MAPRLAAHQDAIQLDPRLFARIDAARTATAPRWACEPEQLRLLERLHTDFVRAGAGLDEPEQERLRELNERLSTADLDLLAPGCWPTPTTSPCTCRTEAELDGLAEDARRRGRAGGAHPRARRLPDHPGAADRPAGAGLAAQPGAAPAPARGLRQPGPARQRARHPRGAHRDRRPARRAGRRCSGSPTTPSYVVADQTAGTRRGGGLDAGRAGRARRRERPRRGGRAGGALHADGHEGRCSRGTGRSTPNGCGGDGSSRHRGLRP